MSSTTGRRTFPAPALVLTPGPWRAFLVVGWFGWCGRARAQYVPGIGPAYLVIDADTIFFEDYSPIPPGSDVACVHRASTSTSAHPKGAPVGVLRGSLGLAWLARDNRSFAHTLPLTRTAPDAASVLLSNLSNMRPARVRCRFNYMPGDPRDCGNPPYFMTMDALGIEVPVCCCATRA